MAEAGAEGNFSPARLKGLGHELVAGLSVAASALPACLAAGVLAYAPLGPRYVAAGVAAGLASCMFAGPVAALAAGSPHLISAPRASTAVIQASLIAALLARPGFADDVPRALGVLALALLLAGLLQMLFGVLGIARIVRFTPHPVLAGFLNGVGLLLILPQLARHVALHPVPHIVEPARLLFMLAVTALIVFWQRLSTRLPGALAGLTLGFLAYYLLAVSFPGAALGPSMASSSERFLPGFPLLALAGGGTAQFAGLWTEILLIALTLAIVATFDTLLTLRIVQKREGRAVQIRRDLVAQGIGNCLAALTGALATQLSPNLVLTAMRSGGRTQLLPLACGAALLVAGLAFSPAIAAVPVVVLSAMVLGGGIGSFDRWSVRLFLATIRNRGTSRRKHAIYDLAVIALVMAITASGNIIAGVLAGAALTCVIFIANMSRPIFRRIRRGDEVASKRVRAAEATQLLLAHGRGRAVLELQGVLFFGNADDLAERLGALYGETDLMTLDLRGISDIDVSGAQVLHDLVAAARRAGKVLLFCNVPADHAAIVAELAGPAPLGPFVMPDLDSAVEWMEEETLRRAEGRAAGAALPLARLDFAAGLDAAELALLEANLTTRQFAAGTSLCVEGDAADRLWLLAKGTVSIRLSLADKRGSARIASLAMGTVVGEMALLASGRRSATVTADEDVECWELEERAFRALLDAHPRLASKVLANLAREMARRVGVTSDYLRHASG